MESVDSPIHYCPTPASSPPWQHCEEMSKLQIACAERDELARELAQKKVELLESKENLRLAVRLCAWYEKHLRQYYPAAIVDVKDIDNLNLLSKEKNGGGLKHLANKALKKINFY